MQAFGLILCIVGGIMVMGTLEGGGSYAIGFWGFIFIAAGLLIEKNL
jgi:hypothetical protein